MALFSKVVFLLIKIIHSLRKKITKVITIMFKIVFGDKSSSQVRIRLRLGVKHDCKNTNQ